MYDENCLSAMRGRQGLYPATACFKMKGTLGVIIKDKDIFENQIDLMIK